MFYTLILENETGQQIDLSKTANRFIFSKAVQSTQFRYNMDYFVGDYVTLEHRRFGLRQNKIQLIGIIESFDQNGRNLTPTFKEG